MQPIVLVGVVGLIAGIAVGIQAPLATMIGQRLGILESVFILHLGGAIVAGVPLLLQRGGSLAGWRTLPWYALGAGVFGLVVVSAVNYAYPRIGATSTIFLVVVGQLLVSVLADQFGLLGVQARPIDLSRLLGIVILLVGVWLIVR